MRSQASFFSYFTLRKYTLKKIRFWKTLLEKMLLKNTLSEKRVWKIPTNCWPLHRPWKIHFQKLYFTARTPAAAPIKSMINFCYSSSSRSFVTNYSRFRMRVQRHQSIDWHSEGRNDWLTGVGTGDAIASKYWNEVGDKLNFTFYFLIFRNGHFPTSSSVFWHFPIF